MKKFTLLLFVISVFASCSERNYIGKIEKYNINYSLDGRTYSVCLVDKSKPDSSEYYINENDFSEFGVPLISHRVILSFRSGTIVSSWVSDKKFESCSSASNTGHGKIIAFSTNCLSDREGVNAMWSGIVKGKNIHGTFSWLLPNNKMVSYSFWGKALKNSYEDDKVPTVSVRK